MNDVEKQYDIIVIGAGSGGLGVSLFMAKVGLKTLLIDKTDADIGGDCLNYGCVPSKALIHVARVTQRGKDARNFGLQINGQQPVLPGTNPFTKQKKKVRW